VAHPAAASDLRPGQLILRHSIDPDRPLPEYGLDSLGALELRTPIETETGIRINPTDLTTIGTIRGFAGLLCEKLAPAEAALDGLENR
jgi:polyketide synthase 5